MQEMKFTTRLACVSLCVYISVCLPMSICKCEYLCISLYLLASLYIPDWKCFSVCTYMHTHLWVHISAYVPMCGPVSTSISMQLCILFLCDLWVCFWYELFCLSMCVLGVGSTSVVVPVFVCILQGKWDHPFIVTISSKVGERNIWLITVSQLYPPLEFSWDTVNNQWNVRERSFQEEKKERGDWYNPYGNFEYSNKPQIINGCLNWLLNTLIIEL